MERDNLSNKPVSNVAAPTTDGIKLKLLFTEYTCILIPDLLDKSWSTPPRNQTFV